MKSKERAESRDGSRRSARLGSRVRIPRRSPATESEVREVRGQTEIEAKKGIGMRDVGVKEVRAPDMYAA